MSSRLPEHRKGTPNFEGLLKGLAVEIQALEDAAYDLLVNRRLDTAQNAQLDVLGKIVGQPRNGMTDAAYRIRIGGKIAANNSEGKVSDIIKVAKAVLAGNNVTLRLEQFRVASMLLHVESGLISDELATVLSEFMRDAAMGGVNMQTHYQTAIDSESFSYGHATQTGGTGPLIVVPGSTILTVFDSSGFPQSGEVIVAEGTVSEEILGYTKLPSNQLALLIPTAIAHPWFEAVRTWDDSTTGYSSTGSPGIGGKFSSVLEVLPPVPAPPVLVSISASQEYNAQNLAVNLLDGTNLGWGNTNSAPVSVFWEYNRATLLTGYTIERLLAQPGGWTSDAYSPNTWVLSGSNGGTWTPIDSRTAQTVANDVAPSSYSVVTATEYKYYRLTMTAPNGWINITNMTITAT